MTNAIYVESVESGRARNAGPFNAWHHHINLALKRDLTTIAVKEVSVQVSQHIDEMSLVNQ